METEKRQREEEQERRAEDESVEEFKRDMEDDPARAPSDDEDLERARGG